ncbi:hypothetical protein ACJZ2D_009383 [Fusarium nematophilum]
MSGQPNGPGHLSVSPQLPIKSDGMTNVLAEPDSRYRVLWAEAIAERRLELVKAGVHNILNIHDFAAIWGGLLVCLECFSQSNQALKAIEEHFGRMARAMPRFEAYMQLYSTHERLSDALLRIYRSYLDACIQAVKFLRQKSWWRPVGSVLSSVVQKFEDACKSITESAGEFEHEARFAHDKEAALHRSESQAHWENSARHQKLVEQALPLVSSHREQKEALVSVPFPRNPHFLGRDKELQQLEAALTGEAHLQKSCVVFGIGGVGKTNLALEFCYQNQDHFPFIFWISAENEAALSTAFAKLATELDLPDAEKGPSPLSTDRMRRWLREHTSWLLVFDNADSDEPAFNKFWPPCDHGSILVTSQNCNWAERTPSIFRLEPFDEDLGSKLLLQHYQNHGETPDMELARSISKEVDNLPLLLVGLGGSLSQNYLSLKETLETLKREAAPLRRLLSNKTPVQYERPVQFVFQLSFSRLPQAARQVIGIMAMLSPNDIPESMIMAKDGAEVGEDTDTMFAKNVRRNLCSRNLVNMRREGTLPTYSMHRSVQRFVVEELSDEERQRAFNEAVQILCSRLPRPSTIMVPHLTGFDLFAKYLPHVLSIHSVFDSLGTLAGNISAYGAGVIWCTGGLINRQQGNDMTWRVLQLREEHIKISSQDPHHLDYENLLSNGYNDWALQLINEGRYSEAKGFSEKSLKMKYRLLDKDKDQFQFFISKILLAVVALSEGDSHQATVMAQDAIAHIEREKGRSDPFTNHYMYHVGNIWSAVGEHGKALGLLKASLEARLRLFGETNHDTLNSHFAVALCLYRLGEYAEARVYLGWCLARAKPARWGREHVLRARYVESLIMQHVEDKGGTDWSMKRRERLEERDKLLRVHAKGRWSKPTSDVEDMVYFDYLINFHAGRTSAVQLD